MGVYSEFKNLFCMPGFPGVLRTMSDKTPVKRRYCVSTAAVDVSHHAPGIAFTGSVADARNRLVQIMSQIPRTMLVTEDQNYLHFECRSRLFRFVDDLEFLIDPDARVIQVRSASRVGYSDLGVNRARVNQVRDAFESNPLDQ